MLKMTLYRIASRRNVILKFDNRRPIARDILHSGRRTIHE